MVLPAGARAPEFTLTSSLGEAITLSTALAHRPVALVFFPLAFSGICQGELCELRDNIAMFDDARVTLMVVSVDSKWSLRMWAEQMDYHFTLLSDFWPHGEVARAFDAFRSDTGIASRATVLIDQDGVIRASFETEPGYARELDQYRRALTTLG